MKTVPFKITRLVLHGSVLMTPHAALCRTRAQSRTLKGDAVAGKVSLVRADGLCYHRPGQAPFETLMQWPSSHCHHRPLRLDDPCLAGYGPSPPPKSVVGIPSHQGQIRVWNGVVSSVDGQLSVAHLTETNRRWPDSGFICRNNVIMCMIRTFKEWSKHRYMMCLGCFKICH